MAKALPEHRDKLGQGLSVGDPVCFPNSNTLYIGIVEKINPKMIKVKKVGGKYAWSANKYPSDLIKLEAADVTFFVLQNS